MQKVQTTPSALNQPPAPKPECITCYYSVIPLDRTMYLCARIAMRQQCEYKEKKDV